MCLHTSIDLSKKTFVGYKVFARNASGLRPPIYSFYDKYSKFKFLEPGKLYTDRIHEWPLRDGAGEEYPCGFHFFFTADDVKAWNGGVGPDEEIWQCEFSSLLAVGTNETNKTNRGEFALAGVARRMKLIKRVS